MNVADLTQLFDKMRCDLKADMEQVVKKAIDERVDKLQEEQKKTFEYLKNENETLKLALEKQKQVIDSMNRLNNIVFYGMPEPQKEDRKSLEEAVLKICTENVKVPLNASDLNWVRRLGKTGHKARPVLVALVSNSKKWDLLQNSSKLKGTNIFIANDLDDESRERRVFMNKVRKLVREGGKDCKWRKGGLLIDGQYLDFDGLKEKYGEAVRLKFFTEERVAGNGKFTPEEMESARKRKRQEDAAKGPINKQRPRTSKKLDDFFRARASSTSSAGAGL